MIELKSPAEIELMYESGQHLSNVARKLKDRIVSGQTTEDLDKIARDLFKQEKLTPAFEGYGVPPFPGAICCSINHEIVHGIPNPNREIKDGDIVSIDIGGIWKGFFSDMAYTVGIGNISSQAKDLINTTRKALENGISKMYTSNKLYDISFAVQQVAESAGYSVVRELVGHGIGRNLHESPQVPNYGKKNTGIKLQAGLVLAVEPMLNVGTHEIIVAKDKWTIETADGQLSGHFENTVAVTDKGPKMLTSL